MNLTKKEYHRGYDKASFYAEMGMFFAEKSYQKEMPYLTNTEQKEWCLFYMDGRLAAFYAHEQKEELTAITGVYVLPGYRNAGIGEQLLDDILQQFAAVRLVTCSQRLLSMLSARHFVCTSRRGSYLTMEWRKKNDASTTDR